jgi:hypothetical protein
MRTQKLYKIIESKLHYHEAWSTPTAVHEHWGIAGHRGKHRLHELHAGEDPDEAVLAVLRPFIDDGFASIDPDDHISLVIEYTIDPANNNAWLHKRHELEDRMNEVLGWTGLGRCLGGSGGAGTMEVTCSVVDFEIARIVIHGDLVGSNFSDYTRIHH